MLICTSIRISKSTDITHCLFQFNFHYKQHTKKTSEQINKNAFKCVPKNSVEILLKNKKIKPKRYIVLKCVPNIECIAYTLHVCPVRMQTELKPIKIHSTIGGMIKYTRYFLCVCVSIDAFLFAQNKKKNARRDGAVNGSPMATFMHRVWLFDRKVI